MSQDPVALMNPNKVLEEPQQLNMYSYVANNPVKYVDPTGLYVEKTGKVEKGDTLSGITSIINNSNNTNYSVQQVAELNNIKNADKIYIDQTLIPNDSVPDITNSFRSVLQTNAQNESINSGLRGIANFYQKVKPGGEWDYKNQPGLYNSKDHEAFVFDGEKVRTDFTGNVNYGYAGSSTKWGNQEFLLKAAGLGQTASNLKNGRAPEWNSSYWDSPGDIDQVKRGIHYYRFGF